jgi:hypothetical protein
MNGLATLEQRSNRQPARIAAGAASLEFRGSRLDAIGFGRFRFMLPRLVLLPQSASLRSIAQPVLTHPGGLRILLPKSRHLSLVFSSLFRVGLRAVGARLQLSGGVLNFFTSRPQLGGDAAGDRARDLTDMRPVGMRSLHAHEHGEAGEQAAEKNVQGVAGVYS